MSRLPTRNPLFLVPLGWGLGSMAYCAWERFWPKYHPWEHRYRDALAEGRIPPQVSLDEFRAHYDDYGRTPYDPNRHA
jgi:hypothetical protein